MIVVGICGTRNPSISYDEFHEILYTELVEVYKKYKEFIQLCSGGACGIDSFAKQFAQEHNIYIKEFYPDYNKYGKSATVIRNQQIVDYSDLIIAFPSKTSRGTRDTIRKAERKGKLYKIIEL